MGDPYKGKLAGHSLVYGGHNYFANNPTRNGVGRGHCSCGEVSDELPTTSSRQQWHRQHKADKIDDFVANGVDDKGREVHL